MVCAVRGWGRLTAEERQRRGSMRIEAAEVSARGQAARVRPAPEGEPGAGLPVAPDTEGLGTAALATRGTRARSSADRSSLSMEASS